MWPRDENQAAIINLAKTIAKKIEPTSSQHDRNGTFPHEHFDFMRKNGYLRACVPIQNGGAGHRLTDMVLAQYEIGKGDGSTAVSVGMHHMVIGTESEAHKWPKELRSQVFTDVVKNGTLVNNIASEPDLGSPKGGGRPKTSLTLNNHGQWLLNGRKTWSTLAPQLAYAIILAAVEDGSGDVARIAQKMDSKGIVVEETWDSISMRASGSHDIVFHDVIVNERDFVSRAHPSKGPGDMISGAAWFPLLLSAANLGIASAARIYAIDFAKNRKPTGAPSTISSIPYVRQQLAEMESILLIARRSLFSCAQDWEDYPDERKHLMPEVSIIKVKSIESAIEITDLAMRIVGGAGLERSRPLERYFRDVRSGIVNPPIEARALEQLASHILT